MPEQSIDLSMYLTIPDLTIEAFHLIVVIMVSFACNVNVHDVICIFAKDFDDFMQAGNQSVAKCAGAFPIFVFVSSNSANPSMRLISVTSEVIWNHSVKISFASDPENTSSSQSHKNTRQLPSAQKLKVNKV